MTNFQTPIHELPSGYQEVRHLVLTDGRKLLWLNLLSIIPLILGLGFSGWWWEVVRSRRGSITSPFAESLSPLIATLVTIALVFMLHEAIHGLFIAIYGHRPYFGFKPQYGVFYATTRNALFPRNSFLVIALAPLVLMTFSAAALMFILPDALSYYLGLIIALNAAGAIGDLWMSAVVLRYPAHALVRDEADSIRIYLPVA